MNHTQFVAAFAHRLGLSNSVAQHVVERLCEEITRQLILGEEVRIAGLGKFTMSVVQPTMRKSNLPALAGKTVQSRRTRKLHFQAYGTVLSRLEGPFTALVSGNGIAAPDWSLRKEAVVAKRKSGEHVTVDLPEGVKQITINVAGEDKKKKGKKESGGSKRRLLG